MTPLYTQALEQRRAEFAGHTLQLDLLQPGYASFLFTQRPGYRGMHTCLITFLPTAIVITGDVAPGHNGIVSSRGYGMNWFRSQCDPRYLAEKFLSKRWVPEHCAESLQAQADDLRDTAAADGLPEPEKAEKLRDLAASIRRGDMMADEVYDELQDLDMADDGLPGHWYDPWELATLAAIQERFAAEYTRIGFEFHKFTEVNWLQQAELYRLNQERSMQKYSTKLGWGITGAQPECWAMLDREVDALATLRRELPMLATNLKDLEIHMRTNMGPGHNAALLSVLNKLKEMGIHPFVTAAAH